MFGLSGCKVAILAINGFERRRFLEGRGSLRKAGAIPIVVSSTRDDLICSWNPSGDGLYTAVDRHVSDVHPPYDALFLPGTVVDPEAVFVDPRAADFVKSFFDHGRPIASLCGNRWLLVHRSNILRGRVKSEPSLSSSSILSESTSAGAEADGSDEDLDGFIRRMLSFFQASVVQGAHKTVEASSPTRLEHPVGAPIIIDDVTYQVSE